MPFLVLVVYVCRWLLPNNTIVKSEMRKKVDELKRLSQKPLENFSISYNELFITFQPLLTLRANWVRAFMP